MLDAHRVPRATGEVQRQQVFVARMVAYRPGGLAAVVEQRRLVVACQLLHHPVAEFPGPGLDHVRAGVPVEFTEVVSDAPGADQQDAFLAQRAERLADPILHDRAEAAGQRQLHHRNIRGGIHQPQRHPGAVVQRPLRVESRRQLAGGQQFDHPCRQVR
ncbi:hypothetical protein D9M71_123180 [compost metagenome]